MATDNHKTLGRNVIPSNYALKFETNLKTFKFRGTEVIRVEVAKPTMEVTLNADLLKISAASARVGKETLKASVTYYGKNQRIVLHFPRKLSGKVELLLSFEGSNNDKLYGFYRSKYSNRTATEYILTTQFEPSGAREAFPCFDEPEFKATFDISFVIDGGLAAISNMPVKKEEPFSEGKKIVTFDTTPRMSSYLLYLAVGKFEFMTGRLGKTEVRLVTVPGKIKYSKMAMNFAKKFLAYYNAYFGIAYPLPKLDFIAIPDFASGAMENWGAITFREIELLGDEKISSVATRQRIASVIAHELAHQWFGDLVTMKWWDDLWLNESFATFMSYKAVDAVYPKWEMKIQNVLEMLAVALAADQLTSTHPISVSVNEPGEIDKIFDEISYEKGGSFLEMLEDYVGEGAFRKGLHNYLLGHKYGNATKYDLWNAVADAASSRSIGGNVRAMASYWIDQPGYPMIDLRQDSSGRFTIEQERYLLLEKKGSGQVWPIPLHYSAGGKPRFDILRSRLKKLPAGNAEYVKLNLNEKGIYRVRYPENILSRIGEEIKAKRLGVIDAWGVENDLYSLARSCRVPLCVYLEFVENYCMDSDYPLNLSVSGHLNGLAMFLYREKSYERIRKIILAFNTRLFKKLGWKRKEGEREVLTMLRSSVIASLGIHGDKGVRRIAERMLSDKMSKNKEIDPNIRSAIYRINAWHGDASLLRKFRAMYLKERMPEEKLRLLGIMGAFSKPSLLERSLAFSLSKDVRYQDSIYIPGSMAGNPIGKDLLWDWTRENWKLLVKRNPSGGHMLKGYVGNLETISSAESLERIMHFFSDKRNRRSDIDLAIEQAFEMIEINVRFVKRNSDVEWPT